MKRPSRYLSAVLAVALFAAFASAQPMLLTGNDKALWLVRMGPEGETYDLLVKRADLDWTAVAKSVRGNVSAVVAVDEQLHLLFQNPLGYVRHELARTGATGGLTPQDDRWGDDVRTVAICAAANVASDPNGAATLLAVVPRTAGPVATTTPAQPELRAADPSDRRTGSPAEAVTLGLFGKIDGRWTHLSDCPAPQALGSQGRLLASAVGETLYVLITDPLGQYNRMLTFRRGRWEKISLDSWPRDSYALGLLSFDRQPVVVLALRGAKADSPARSELRLGRLDPDKRTFILQPVTLEGKAVAWDTARLPLAARLTDGVALLWSEDHKLKLAKCSLNGQMLGESDVDLHRLEPIDESGTEILQKFQWVLLFVVLLPMVLLQPRSTAAAFSLPETMRPASLIKRFLAWLVDFMPCSFLVFSIFLRNSPSEEQLRTILSRNVLPAYLAYAFIGTLLLYTAYCIIMERKFGATVGKMLFKLRVVGDEGGPAGARGILLRNLVRMVELSWTLGPLLLVVLPLLTRYRQRLGDMMGRTAVIDTTYAPPPAPPQEPSQYGSPDEEPPSPQEPSQSDPPDEEPPSPQEPSQSDSPDEEPPSPQV